MTLKLSVVAIALSSGILGSPIDAAQAQQVAAPDVERALREFLAPFSRGDVAGFIGFFAEDATMFFPANVPQRSGISASRVNGRAEIERAFGFMKPDAAARLIEPQDLVVQGFAETAVVTFHLGAGARGRRTFVMRQIGSEWKIVHLHASLFDAPRP